MVEQETKRFRIERIRDWLIVFLFTMLIYLTLPIMPQAWKGFRRLAGGYANHIAAIILVIIGFIILIYLIRQRRGGRSICWFLVLALIYAWALSRLKLPVERIHFLEYGLLSVFVFRALAHDIKNRSIYLWSALIVFSLGLVDEIIQYFLPNRVYDTRDVIVNGLAGILGLLIIALCFQPDLKKQ
jgi:putative Mn2+ efflux pump MntP